MTEFTVNVKELKQLAADLTKVDPALSREFRVELGRAGEVVASAARRNAAQHSSRIPSTIGVRYRGVRVRVQAGGGRAPHAAPFEHHGLPGTFRHPVFGHMDRWVPQRAHPFLTPAAIERMGAFEAGILRAVDAAFTKAGFK